MRRWRVKCVKAHKLPCGHEIQNDVLHCGKIKTKGWRGKNRRLLFFVLFRLYIIYMERGRGRATKGDQAAADKTADKTVAKLTA